MVNISSPLNPWSHSKARAHQVLHKVHLRPLRSSQVPLVPYCILMVPCGIPMVPSRPLTTLGPNEYLPSRTRAVAFPLTWPLALPAAHKSNLWSLRDRGVPRHMVPQIPAHISHTPTLLQLVSYTKEVLQLVSDTEANPYISLYGCRQASVPNIGSNGTLFLIIHVMYWADCPKSFWPQYSHNEQITSSVRKGCK